MCTLFSALKYIENHVAELRHERGRKLWFDVSEVQSDTKLMLGELRIYQNPELAKWRNTTREYVITVYTISETGG